MRQAKDLLVWVGMTMAFLAVLYLAPRIASSMSDDPLDLQQRSESHELVLRTPWVTPGSDVESTH